MKLDLDNMNVIENELTVQQIRDHFDGKNPEVADEIDGWLDRAQGDIHSGQQKEMWIVIKVVP